MSNLWAILWAILGGTLIDISRESEGNWGIGIQRHPPAGSIYIEDGIRGIGGGETSRKNIVGNIEDNNIEDKSRTNRGQYRGQIEDKSRTKSRAQLRAMPGQLQGHIHRGLKPRAAIITISDPTDRADHQLLPLSRLRRDSSPTLFANL